MSSENTGKKNTVATENTPDPEQAPKYEVPVKELLIGKAGIGDLYNKLNELIRLINDLLVHQKLTKDDLLPKKKSK